MDNIIGLQIQKGRTARKWSQSELAEMLYVSKQAVGKWERGESLPDIFTLSKISELFGEKDLNYFLGKPFPLCSCTDCKCDCNKTP